MALVSILIPVHNAEPWLAETIRCALAQSWPHKEIIIVDDGSTDSSFDVAQSFAGSSCQIIRQDNRGAAAARNRAFKESQGEYIQYLDADDLLAADKIERQVGLLMRHDGGNYIASGRWKRFTADGADNPFRTEPVWKDMTPVEWLVCSWEGGGMMHPGAWLVPRPVAVKAGPWNEELSLYDDGEYFCRVILASRGVLFCEEAKSYYRSGIAGSLSSAQSSSAWDAGYRALELCERHLRAAEDSRRVCHACAASWARFVYTIFPHEPKLAKRAEARIQALGGSTLTPPGGALFQLLRPIFGWRNLRKLQAYRKLVVSKIFGS